MKVNRKQKKREYLLAAAGISLAAAGVGILITVSDPQGMLIALPYVCIGAGCGIFGHGMGSVLSRKTIQSNPQMQKRVEIEQKKERNIVIADWAKGKAFDMMTYVFGAWMPMLTLMRVHAAAVLLIVFSYLFVHGYAIYCKCKFEREM